MLRLTVSELVRVLARRRRMRIKTLAEELGYRPATFYAKLYKDKWKIEDLTRLKDYFDVTLDDILNLI